MLVVYDIMEITSQILKNISVEFVQKWVKQPRLGLTKDARTTKSGFKFSQESRELTK